MDLQTETVSTETDSLLAADSTGEDASPLLTKLQDILHRCGTDTITDEERILVTGLQVAFAKRDGLDGDELREVEVDAARHVPAGVYDDTDTATAVVTAGEMMLGGYTEEGEAAMRRAIHRWRASARSATMRRPLRQAVRTRQVVRMRGRSRAARCGQRTTTVKVGGRSSDPDDADPARPGSPFALYSIAGGAA